jgi:alkaline phosphatase
MRILNAVFALLLAAAALAADRPKNVILMIGDGMGPAHFTALRNARGDAARVMTMPVLGMQTTNCADRTVTDSAAAATALATGVKTNYEMLSIAPSGVVLPTVLERAGMAGKATGVVTTSYFFDATPAAFTAHATHRRKYGEIVPQMLRSGANVILGGGLSWFGKNDLTALDTAVEGTGYTLLSTPADLDAAKGSKLLLVYETGEQDRDNPSFPLPRLAKFAIDHLRDDPDGFFLMIEHEGTDSGSHQNNSTGLVESLKSFDEAVGVALDFAAANKETLVVVTGDHETGGMRIGETPARRPRIAWSDVEHTATAVPVFAYGPGSAAFAGWQDNTDIGKKLMAAVQ